MQPLGAEVLRFWFGELDDGFADRTRAALWFGSSVETDRVIRDRFGTHVEHALAGGYQDWLNEPRAGLALVLMLDQFPRNIFRGEARAFAGDERARRVARTLLAADLAPIEKVFLYMPFEHSEALADQELCLSLFSALVESVAPQHRETMRNNLRYAEQHHAIIARFGRFPHRNAVLGRANTVQEQDYLNSGASRFGQ